MSDVTRRRFVKTVAGTGAALTIVPRHVLGRGMQAPSDTVNIATVGIGGMGGSNTMAVLSQNIVAACDVDDRMMQRAITRFEMALKQLKEGGGQQRGGGGMPRREPSEAQKAANARRPATDRQAALVKFGEQQLPKMKKYRDYREMIDKQKDIDAVIVATPDHMHYAVAAYAMDHGKHVYVQKPLTWSVEESRLLAKKAKETKLVGQMGNQGHSMDDARTGYEYINSGVIGDVREVHVCTNRPLGFWPQGIPRPTPMPPAAAPSGPMPPAQQWNGRYVDQKIADALSGDYPVPTELDWDLFLGVAPKVDYHPIYHPMNWRGWVDWGQGALGDMGAHLIDHPFWALDLGMPTTIETVSTPFNGASYPHATMTYYQFPARGSKPPVTLIWYDGGFLPPKPEEMGDTQFDGEGGILYVGSKGKMLQNTYGANPRLLPLSRHEQTPKPKQMLPRIAHQEHEMNWVEAIKGNAEISCPLDYAAALNEVMLLGVVALRAGSKITYDGASMKVTSGNVTINKQTVDPNDFLRREPRPGFVGTR